MRPDPRSGSWGANATALAGDGPCPSGRCHLVVPHPPPHDTGPEGTVLGAQGITTVDGFPEENISWAEITFQGGRDPRKLFLGPKKYPPKKCPPRSIHSGYFLGHLNITTVDSLEKHLWG